MLHCPFREHTVFIGGVQSGYRKTNVCYSSPSTVFFSASHLGTHTTQADLSSVDSHCEFFLLTYL